MSRTPCSVTIAVCAYNEEGNIGSLLERVCTADPGGAFIQDILVVSSGSTDRTDAIVTDLCQRYPDRLRLISEDRRNGKIAAVNIILREARTDSIILVDADCLPAPALLEKMASTLGEDGVGGVGTRNVPVNGGKGLIARLGELLWAWHHAINLREPVLGGDIIAFKRLFPSLSTKTCVNDDFAIECEVRRRGYRIAYLSEGRTFMRVPTRLRDFIDQRRRINFGFLREGRRFGAIKATQNPRRYALAAVALLVRRPGILPLVLLLCALELWSKILAYKDLLSYRDLHRVWISARSTKQRISEEHWGEIEREEPI